MLLIVGMVSAIEYVFIYHWQLGFQSIITHDCDPAKLLAVEEILDSHTKPTRIRALHLLIASQAAALVNDVKHARTLLSRACSMSRHLSLFEPMAHSVALDCACLEKDWERARELRDDLAKDLDRAHKLAMSDVETCLLFADEALAMAEGDLWTAEQLLERCAIRVTLPQQRASLAFRCAQFKEVKCGDETARPYYRQAAEEGGTCFFATEAAEWMASRAA